MKRIDPKTIYAVKAVVPGDYEEDWTERLLRAFAKREGADDFARDASQIVTDWGDKPWVKDEKPHSALDPGFDGEKTHYVVVELAFYE